MFERYPLTASLLKTIRSWSLRNGLAASQMSLDGDAQALLPPTISLQWWHVSQDREGRQFPAHRQENPIMRRMDMHAHMCVRVWKINATYQNYTLKIGSVFIRKHNKTFQTCLERSFPLSLGAEIDNGEQFCFAKIIHLQDNRLSD